VLGVTRKTVQADWKVAKMWLRRELAWAHEGLGDRIQEIRDRRV